MPTPDFRIDSLGPADKGWVLEWIAEQWHAPKVVAHDVVYLPHQLPGFAARPTGTPGSVAEPLGLVTYKLEGKDCEIVTLDSRQPNRGIGSALVDAVVKQARQVGCRRVWLVTTNDNLHAVGFYQKRGFRLCRVDVGAVDRARRIKPEIPMVGDQNIPLHDEIEMEMSFG